MQANVNWSRITRAIDFYVDRGYRYIEVPWLVGEEAYSITSPPDKEREWFRTHKGHPVASGEQSFLELLLKGKDVGKAVCCTPCFRSEPVLDELRHLHFMKVELISAPDVDFGTLMLDAWKFLESEGLVVEWMKQIDGSIDLVEKITGIELGSYGVRNTESFTWSYGTGLAEPRYSYVYELLSKDDSDP